MYDIYIIVNKSNDKKYIGYTSKGYKIRFQKHLTESKTKSVRYLCKAIRKYGKENFKVELLEVVQTHEEAKVKEMYYIQKLKTYAHDKDHWGYNGTLGGDGTDGHVVPAKLRKRLSDLKKAQKSWSGKDNPNYGKGLLMSGEKHFNFGKKHSLETKEKISNTNKGRLKGERNPSSVKCVCYAFECETGVIFKFDSFYSMRFYFEEKGVSLNRSSTIQVIRGGRKSHKGYIFYREDITDQSIFKQIEYKYQHSIFEPKLIKEHREGKKHPNAKNMLSFAECIETKDIYKFNSWYDLKQFVSENSNINVTYSNMSKALANNKKHVGGYKLYREDKTDVNTFKDVLDRYTRQNEPSTTSRKA